MTDQPRERPDPAFFLGKKFNEYTLHLAEPKSPARNGRGDFSLFVKDDRGNLSDVPIVQVGYSSGGEGEPGPGIDVKYHDELRFGTKKNIAKVALAGKGADQKFFRILGEFIAPGGHITVSYQEGGNIQRDTGAALDAGVPAVATPLGFLIFIGGCQLVRNLGRAENGCEGPHKLRGEKAPDRASAGQLYNQTFQQIIEYLKGDFRDDLREMETAARNRAKAVLERIEKYYRGG